MKTGETLEEQGGFLSESSVSRLLTYTEKHDCAVVAAFRDALGDAQGNRIALTRDDNVKRSKLLLAKIQTAGYVATRMVGRYPGDHGESKFRISFFVVDLHDKGTLLSDLRTWGEYFFQESVLFIPRGSVLAPPGANGSDSDPEARGTAPYLVAINKAPDQLMEPSGTIAVFGMSGLATENPLVTTVVNGKPINLERIDEGFHGLPGSGMGHCAMGLVARLHWQDIPLTADDLIYYGGV